MLLVMSVSGHVASVGSSSMRHLKEAERLVSTSHYLPVDKLLCAFLVQLVTADKRKRHHAGDLFRGLRLACSSSGSR